MSSICSLLETCEICVRELVLLASPARGHLVFPDRRNFLTTILCEKNFALAVKPGGQKLSLLVNFAWCLAVNVRSEEFHAVDIALSIGILWCFPLVGIEFVFNLLNLRHNAHMNLFKSWIISVGLFWLPSLCLSGRKQGEMSISST